MPSTTSSVVSMVLDSSTVMTPSLPTFFIASAMIQPICLSLLAEMVPTWAIMSPFTSLCSFMISSTATSTALSIPRFRAVGLAPAATVFTPSRKMACARTVAVVVPSPATSDVFEATSRTICAPMFSRGYFSSISFATLTPSLVMMGAPNFFSITALRPLGPRVILTASARAFTPRRMDWRGFSPVTIVFAISLFLLQSAARFLFSNRSGTRPVIATAGGASPAHTGFRRRLANLKIGHYIRRRRDLLLGAGCLGGAAELREDFVFAENQDVFVFDLDFGAGILAEENAV